MMIFLLSITLCYLLCVDGKKPNIIIIVADDLGRNDVGFHGSSQIPTPNIDALAYNGIILDRFYTQSICTPSRAALLTGNYPIRSGMQGYPLKAGENRSLPLDMKTMPEHLKKLGYKTHLVGKWHLGAAYKKNTPIGRGFDTHFGYWNGLIGYFDHVSFVKSANGTIFKGLDFFDQFQPVWSAQGQYATELFTQRALHIIDSHDVEVPLFLMVSHLAPHVGKDGVELGVPNATLTDAKYAYIKDPRRRLYADVVNLMDESIGQVVKKLSEKNLLENSIILFFSDNGGQTVGLYSNSASNWPLRGTKFSDFEGGVRTAASIFSPLFKKKGYVNKELIHITDWLPTLYAAAGGDLKDLGTIDGINQWEALSIGLQTNRSEILVNIDDLRNTSALITEKGRYKFLQGTFGFSGTLLDNYFGESGRGSEVPPYNPEPIIQSVANQMIQKFTTAPITKEQIGNLRAQTDLSWCRNVDENPEMDCTEGCLFDLINDPCETANLIKRKSEVVSSLHGRIEEFGLGLVPRKVGVADPKSFPVYYNNSWCTWLDDGWCFKTTDIERLK